MFKFKIIFIFVTIFFLLFNLTFPLFIIFNVNAVQMEDDTNMPINFDIVANSINISRIKSHVAKLSSFQTRLTGYEGCVAASNYIEEKLLEIGLKVKRHSYPVLVPVDQGTNVTLLPQGITYEAYALWPNGIQTCPIPPEGIEGRIIYVGKGRLADFDGLNVTDSIVLMDFNSQENWLNAAKLGAKAVIFIEPYETIRTEALQKFILTPLHFPRIYLPRNEGLNLLKMIQGGQVTRVRIKSRMLWQQRTADNLIAVIQGQELPDEIIIVGAYYDSWSVVPKLSPGAEEAISPAVLLELAELLHKYPPKRTVWLVFYSGHWQALSGARYFVEDYYFQNQTYATGTKKILMHIGVQLSSDSDTLSFVMPGDFYGQPLSEKPWGLDDIYRLFFREWIPVLSEKLSYDFSYHFQDAQTLLIAESDFFDSEASSVAGIASFTFYSTNALRLRVGTPFDTVEKISWTNLKPQILFTSCAIAALANQNFEKSYLYKYWQTPKRVSQGEFIGSDYGPGWAGFANLIGRVEEFNLTSGFYQPVPKALVEVIRISEEHGWYRNRFNPFTHILTLADENGEFRIPGVSAWTVTGYYCVFGWLIDPSNGSIVYAPDLGTYGAGGLTLTGYNFLDINIDRATMFVKTIVFRCKSVVLFDVINPLLMRQNRRALHFYSNDVELPPISLAINDFTSHSSPMSYGLITPRETGDNLAMLFITPETRFEVLLTTTTPENPRVPLPTGILINASETRPEGSGYSPNIGAIKWTGFKFLRDLIYLDDLRIARIKDYRMLTPSARKYIRLARTYFEKALEELNRMQYSKAYDYLIVAWNFEANAYREIRGVTQDLINASIVFCSLIIPFAIIFERLISSTSGLKRFLVILGLIICFVLMAAILHPGFALASNTAAAILGLSVLVIGVPLIAIIFSNLSKYAKQIRSKVLGAHFAEIARSEAIMSAISTGISNLRKRSLRTILNLLTISIIIFSLVSFTSASSFTLPRGHPLTTKAPYPGMMLRQRFGMTPFSPQILSLLSTLLGSEAVICPRAWAYPPAPGESGTYTGSWTAGIGSLGWQQISVSQFPALIFGPNGTKSPIRALLGLLPEEDKVTGISRALIPGSRWFVKGDMFTCILSQETQSRLKVEIGDTINIMGLKLQIIGVADTKMLEGIYDLSGDTLAPIDPVRPMGAAELIYSPLAWDYVMIVPFELAYNIFNGRINTIAVRTENATRVKEVVNNLVMGTYEHLEIFMSTEEGDVLVYRRGKEFAFKRAQMMIFPIIIGGLTILTTLIGSVMERSREIAVYSTIGLSPLHVTGMFLAESLTYAILGSIFGYLSGLAGIRMLLLFQYVPEEMTVNFSSSFVWVAIGFSMLLVLLSSVFPAWKAGLMVTPSLERKWEIKTKPLGDEWFIPTPFVSTEKEVDGVLRYLSEFLEIYTSRDMKVFYLRDKEIRENLAAENPYKELVAEVALAPWDSGTIQKVFIRAIQQEKKKGWVYQIHLKFIGGDRNVWINRNHAFVDIIRKQFLMWRGLKEEEKKKYLS
ncbi:FtsX-like permease family protein [Candidatus Bathyarchaeota archaeon]|nr:FtsX-like permease family protein [Candidatus Bathyarchaeota archaeon]